MKTYKIRGQISLELIMLILVALLGAVVVGVTIPNNLVNITSVEDTKEVVFEGFVKGGGTPVSFSGNDNPSNSGTTENSNAGDNSTVIVDDSTSNNSTIDNNSTADNSNTEDNSTVVLPDLVPVELIVQYENGSEITKCGRYRYRHGQNDNQNTGENRCQCPHKHRHCKNNHIVKIITIIKNQGGNISNSFYVALMVNNKINQTKTILDIDSNTWIVEFDEIKISTNECGGKCHGCGKGHGCGRKNGKNKKCDREVNYTFTVVVDYFNTVNESNEDNNNISVSLSVDENNENNNNNNDTTTTGGNEAESLELSFNGKTWAKITSEIIEGGKSLPGKNININIPGNKIKRYNAKGDITGSIKVNGNSKLYLGNLSKIGTLNIRLVGKAGDDIGITLGVQKIDYLDIGKITGNVYLVTLGTNITTMYVEEISGKGKLTLNNVYIETLNIGGIKGKKSELVIKYSTINKVVGSVNLNSENVNIVQSWVNGTWYD